MINSLQWIVYFRQYWYKDDLEIGGIGWDWSIRSFLKKNNNFRVIQPRRSRTNHIGRIGTHCRADFHDKTFSEIKLAKNKNQSYIIIDNEKNLKEGIKMPHSDTYSHKFMIR